MIDDRLNNLLKLKLDLKCNVIFGLGTTARLLIDLLEGTELQISAILVSEGYNNILSYEGIPVYSISDFPLNKKECNILFTVKNNQDSLIDFLKENKFKYIVDISGQEEYIKLLNIYYENYLEKNGIDFLDSEILAFKNLKLINSFLISRDMWDVFLIELGDLVLPSIMSDYSRVDEGSYEWGNVILEESDIVFDCGAHIGIFSSIAASKKCSVYSFEPVYENIKYLKKSKDLYSEFIHIVPYALSDKNGHSKILISNEVGSEARIINDNEDSNNVIIVETITIDKYVKDNNIEKVDFIKADIEGAERYMIMGARETLAKFAPKLSICTYHLEDDPKILEELIKEANPNYIVEHKWKKLYAYVP